MKIYSLNWLREPFARRSPQLSLLVIVLWMFLCTFAHASRLDLFQLDNGNNIDKLTITRVQEPLTLDGQDNEQTWQEIQSIGRFHQTYPEEYAQGIYPTEVKIAYDENHIYVFARLYDEEIDGLSRNVMSKGQNIWQDDVFGIVLDPFNSKTNGFYFVTNANGYKEEGLIANNNTQLSNWDGIWDVAVLVEERSWSVEMKIPFSTLSFDTNINEWGINFFREIKTPEQKLFWASHGNTLSPWAPEHAGSVIGVKGISQGKGLDVKLSASFNHESERAQDLGFSFEPSLDVTYKITPSITSVFTFNTDFSATEIDEQQINFTRFSLFTPEKRQFFLEGADIFEFGDIATNGRPFFSRTIGLASSGAPLPINAGVKLTGQWKDTRFGLLSVNQDVSEDTNDTTTLSVLRVNQQLSESFSIGAIATHGDMQNNNNYVVGSDFKFRNKSLLDGDTIEVKGWYQQSHDIETGEAFNLGVYLPNEYFAGQLAYTNIDENYYPALGFVNRTNVEQVDGFFSLTSPFKFAALNNLYHNLVFDFVKDKNDLEQSEFVRYDFFDAVTKNQHRFKLSFSRFKEELSTGFLLVNNIDIPEGNYSYNQWEFSMDTDPSRDYSMYLTLTQGGMFQGDTKEIKLGASVNWNRHVRTSLDIDIRNYDFPEDSFTVRSLSAKADLALSPNLFWNNWFQYDNVSRQLGIYSRIVWKPNSLTSLTLAVNQSYLEESDRHFVKQQQETIFKFSYLKRF